MTDAPSSIVSHVSLGSNDLAAATRFYNSVLPTLAIRRIMEHPRAVAYGRAFPEFWIEVGRPDNERAILFVTRAGKITSMTTGFKPMVLALELEHCL